MKKSQKFDFETQFLALAMCLFANEIIYFWVLDFWTKCIVLFCISPLET